MSLTEAPIVADVRLSASLERLVVSPRRPATPLELKARLNRSLPTRHLTRVVQGVAVAATDAPQLLADTPGVRLVFSEEARRFCTNRAMAYRLQPMLHAAVRRLRSGEVDLARLRDELEGGLVLDDHQVVNVAAMTHPAAYGLCLFDEQGAGKTVSAIYAWDLLAARDEVDLALIVAPKSMVPEWIRDLDRFKGKLYKARAVTGTEKEKRAALAAGGDVLVTNFETVASLEQELTAIVRRLNGRAILIADESFLVKNLDARRTRAVRRLREWCGRAYVLCGTPAPNSAHDLVQQFALADFGTSFAGVAVPKDRAAAIAVVRTALRERGVYLRHLKRDVLPGLPAKSFDIVRMDLEPLQARAYDRASRDLLEELEVTDDDEFRRRLISFVAKRSRLLQICSNPSHLVPGYREIPTKLRALDDILEELVVRGGEKVVVWSFFTASLEAVAKRYAPLGVVRYDGTITDVVERREAVRKFQEDETTRLFVANPAAAGAGLTLHASRYAVYESFSNQAAHYLQSLDRIHRRGQLHDVRYLVLLCNGTVEEKEFERLRQKEVDAQDLLGDVQDPPVTRQSMLDELRVSLRRPQE